MPFLIANAPVRGGSVCSFRFSAAAGECESSGLPGTGDWLNLLGLLRRGAVDQPYLTPRLVI